jgi:hypothetical protein
MIGDDFMHLAVIEVPRQVRVQHHISVGFFTEPLIHFNIPLGVGSWGTKITGRSLRQLAVPNATAAVDTTAVDTLVTCLTAGNRMVRTLDGDQCMIKSIPFIFEQSMVTKEQVHSKIVG